MENTNFIKRKDGMCKAYENEDRDYLEIETSYYTQRMQKFVGVVNLLSLICPELQKLLKPTYDLTRKGRVGELIRSELLMKLKDGYRSLQSCICLTIRGDSTFALTPVSLLFVVHYTTFKMDSQG